ncbi:TetR/AcrR family transcriptional regulator [Actinomadura flavalba]|uniref:TetR/AcrR family transcriptional regulator n=1 Tax=Actinomadura flavalba TaxID=1120938 RepID=UPI00035C3C4D|nr:TetR/AcrR family transcriptional regulator [Actinomadura flavalba]
MARTKEFDPDAVLHRAMELFWARGYEATTMADLVEHLGIGRASIYATFGGKRDLYLKAYDRYVELGVDWAGLLSQPGPVLPAVRALVERFAADATGPGAERGCLVVNTAVELVPHDAAAARRVAANWDFVEATLTSALTRAAAQGELAADRNPRALARFVLTVLQGMRVVGKGADDPARLRDAAATALSVLD